MKIGSRLVRAFARARSRVLVLVVVLSAFAGLAAATAPQHGASGGTSARQGTRDASVRPKRAGSKRASKTADGPILAETDFHLGGPGVHVSPERQPVPKNTQTIVRTELVVADGVDPEQALAELDPNYRVRGTLSGPSISTPVTIEAPVGQNLAIPPFAQSGEHRLTDLRVVDTSPGANGATVDALSVDHDTCYFDVIEQLLVSEVRVEPLSAAEITQAGIVIDDDSYSYYNFTLALGTTSNAQQLTLPVAFPRPGVSDPRPIVLPTPTRPGAPELPPAITALPVLLEPVEGAGPAQVIDGGGEPVRIPGVVVIPGQIGLLHEFFEAIVIVSNGAPTSGTPLRVSSLSARVELPDEGATGPDGDPLRVAATQTGGQVTQLAVHGLGADGEYGTPDDATTFSPGESGQASFLLEGLKEGLHEIHFHLDGTLEGMPAGPIPVAAEVPGAVLVRDPRFAVTFTHPSVVRAGQEYDFGMTLYNASDSRDIGDATVAIDPLAISGASLLNGDPGFRSFGEVEPGTSKTVTWRLRANVTGQVTASYHKVEGEIEGGLTLSLGVGDRDVPLSPDSLILPTAADYLPDYLVEAGRELLGQAWSVATAPPSVLPSDVTPVDRQTVAARAGELAAAGLRVRLGETTTNATLAVLRDWLGEQQPNPDPGFADVLRDTPAGYGFFDAAGRTLRERVVGGSPAVDAASLHRSLVEAEMPRSAFASALVTQPEGTPVVGARIVDASGHATGFLADPGSRAGDLATGASARLLNPTGNAGAGSVLGDFLAVSRVENFPYTLELNAYGAGTVSISLAIPAGTGSYRQVVFSNVTVAQGDYLRVAFRPFGASDLRLEKYVGGAWTASGVSGTVTSITDPAPRVVSVVQLTPEIVDGGDRYGRFVGVYFSKPMSATTATDPSHYAIGGGELVATGEIVGGPITVLGASLNFGDRVAVLSLDAPVGPFIHRNVTVRGVTDRRGLALDASTLTRDVETHVQDDTLSPGAYVTGRVLEADGSTVANASVIDWAPRSSNSGAFDTSNDPHTSITIQRTNAEGRYAIDYVRNGSRGPVTFEARSPSDDRAKTISTTVAYDGQHLVVDLVFIARGSVAGTIHRHDGSPAAWSYVQVVANGEVAAGATVQANQNGQYRVDGIPVGAVTVYAASADPDDYNASGIGAGAISGPGAVAPVDVTFQDVSGSVGGQVVQAENSGANALAAVVRAYANLPGYGNTLVGYAYAFGDGHFRIDHLPIGPITLQVTNYSNEQFASTTVTLTNAQPEILNIVLNLAALGSVSGRVVDDLGNPIATAIVSGAGGQVATDGLGYFDVAYVPPGTYTVTATDRLTHNSGSAAVTVQSGQTVEGVKIVIARPSTVTGTVRIEENGTTRPLAGATVTLDGFTRVTTNGAGRYTIPNVVPNAAYTLRVVDPTEKLGANLPVVVGTGFTLTRDLTLRPASLRGTVYQPDGTSGTVATVTAYVTAPNTTEPARFGLLDGKRYDFTTGADGAFDCGVVNPGGYLVTSSNTFFPTPVTVTGTVGPNEAGAVSLSLVNTLAGTIEGNVKLPDGAPAGAGVEVRVGGDNIGEVSVRTDGAGHYHFAEVFPEGWYDVTAKDTATGFLKRERVFMRRELDLTLDLKLVGKGAVRVRVVDAAGQPVANGSVRVEGTEYPRASAYATIASGTGGVLTFDGLYEGAYAISADSNGISGRATAAVTNGATSDVTITLQPAGTVTGHVFYPESQTPAALCDVKLWSGPWVIGVAVTSDADADLGSFRFENVVAGDYGLDVFDNRTGRYGRTSVRVTAQGEVVVGDVNLLRAGKVQGTVTSNGAPVDHALVRLSAGRNGLYYLYLNTTTSPDGSFLMDGVPEGDFSISATAVTGETGGGTGALWTPLSQPLQTTVNVRLSPSATIAGTVTGHDGSPYGGANVALVNGPYVTWTTSLADGTYRFVSAGLGTYQVQAFAPGGYDRGRTSDVVASVSGSTVTADVALEGVGTVTGTARASDGSALSGGTVALTNDVWGYVVAIYVPVQPNGSYAVQNVPVGNFAERLTVPNDVRVGVGTGAVTAGQNTALDVTLEPAGSVTGLVRQPDGTTPSVGANVTLVLERPSAAPLRFYTNTTNAGAFRVDNLPLGTATAYVNDTNVGGQALGTGALATNGQVLDVGTLTLDVSTPTVVSTSPAANATGVSPTADVVITFSEPLLPATVHGGSFVLRNADWNPYTVPAGVSLSPDGTVVTIHPWQPMRGSLPVYAHIEGGVCDAAGNTLGASYDFTYTTADTSAFNVVNITPGYGALEQPADVSVSLTFNRAVDPAQNLAACINISVPVTGRVEPDGKTVTYTPVSPLPDNTGYTAYVNGIRSTLGETQSSTATILFLTHDSNPPTLGFNPADGEVVTSFQPPMRLTRWDNESGLADWQCWVDGAPLNPSNDWYAFTYVPPAPLAFGTHTVRIRSTDRVGNVADETHTFTIDHDPPVVSSFTIGGQPAADGLIVSSTLRPVFAATFTDHSGIDLSRTQLLIGPPGGTPAAVAATKTGTSLTYQPPSNLAAGVYTAELVVVDTLGTQASSGIITFTVTVPGPSVTSVSPGSGSEHGSTRVAITGDLLLNTNNSAPTVVVSGFPALVESVVAGTPNVVNVVMPAGSPGGAVIKLTNDRGTVDVSGAYTYTDDPGSPLALESDTIGLWHLDGPSGAAPAIESPFPSNYNAYNGNAPRGAGHAGAARQSLNINMWQGAQYYSFPNGDFTLEAWVKTGPVTSKSHILSQSSGSCGYELSLLPGGGVRAYLVDVAGVQWTTDSNGAQANVADNAWHYIAMTVGRFDTTDPVGSQAVVYVDGVERARSSRPAGFTTLTNGGPYLYLDNSAVWIDDARVSASAHAPEAIARAFAPDAASANPTPLSPVNPRLPRGETTVLTIRGYNLASVAATYLYPDDTPAGDVQILANSETALKVSVTVPAGAVAGDAVLRLISPRGACSWSVPVFSPSAALLEPDTAGLLHFDGNIADSGPYHMNVGGGSTACPGRVGGGVTGGGGNLYITNNDAPNLSFADGRFTIETWFRSKPWNNEIALWSRPSEYWLGVEPNGTVRGALYDQANARWWYCDMPMTAGTVVDDAWHHIAFVADVPDGRLTVYVDGTERADSAKPSWFSAPPAHIPNYTFFSASANVAVSVDEARISNTAHSASQVAADGGANAGPRISTVTPSNFPRDSGGSTTTTTAQLTGRNLAFSSVAILRDGVPVDGVSAVVTSSSDAGATVSVAVASTAAIGPADLVVTGAGGGSHSVAVSISEAYAPRPIAADTRVLYHFDRPDDGWTLFDSGPFGLNAGSWPFYYNWSKVPGRYGTSIAGMGHNSRGQNGALAFPQQSFTVDLWVNYAPGGGWRRMSWCGTGENEAGRIFWFGLSPTNSLWAEVDSSTSQRWICEVPASTIRIDDGAWHWVAMSVDRENDRLVVYVDGVERAEVPKPAGFGDVRSNPENAMQFAAPGLIDELRVSSSAFDASRAMSEFTGYGALRVTSATPESLARKSSLATATTTTLSLSGYELDGVAARVERDGAVLDGVTATVTSSSYPAATVDVAVDPGVALGAADLVLSRAGSPDARMPLTVVEPRATEVEPDTVLLWRMDDVTWQIGDAGPNLLGGAGGTATPNGVVNGARVTPACTVAPDGGLLSFASSSFTSEFWIKTSAVGGPATLMLKGHLQYGDPNTGYRLLQLPTGALEMTLWDTNGLTWVASTSGSYGWVDDGRWHRVAVVLDRTNEILLVYVDGAERARTSKPAGFTSVRTTTNPLWVFYGAADETIDEFRISSTAHSAEKIYDEWCGIEGISKAEAGSESAWAGSARTRLKPASDEPPPRATEAPRGGSTRRRR